MRFQPFDLVDYVGKKLASELHSKTGVVVARVGGYDTVYTVEFGDDAFIVNEDSLRRHVSTSKDEPDIRLRRRKRRDEDED